MVPGAVDSHQHFWQVGHFDYPWMSPEVDVLFRDYLPADLEPLLASAGVARTVLVQASDTIAETRWMLDLADASPVVAGVVGWVDLAGGGAGRQLDELAARPAFKGVRHIVEDEPDDGWLVRADVLAGLRELAARGLSFDLLVHARHLEHVLRVAEAVPNLALVVDHAAKPPIRSGAFEAWAEAIARVAAVPTIHCKLSGLVTEANHAAWTDEDLRPYVAHVRSCFGAERLMFGSDWPVCLLAGSYGRIASTYEALCADLDGDQRALVFRDTATRFYRL
jgi:L-fuconolactonase